VEHCTSQELPRDFNQAGMVKDSLIVGFDNDCPHNEKVKRRGGRIDFMLMEVFDDTLSMYINRKFIGSWNVFRRTIPIQVLGGLVILIVLTSKECRMILLFY